MELWPADVVRTERFVLRPYAVSDAEEMLAAIGDSQAELIPWMPWALELGTIEERRGFVQGRIDDLARLVRELSTERCVARLFTEYGTVIA
jgi:hypothetical protein